MNQIMQSFINSSQQSILGKDREVKLALCCFLSEGHLLIEDVPGMGKTTFAKTMARLLNLSFARIQFTNDLMPADLLGLQIFDQESKGFRLIPGPIFNQFILADELNRGTPKTQSALLEAMEERQVTLDGKTMELPRPFFVVATQNPRHQVGTHPLPESQLDRFMMKMKIGYPEKHLERIIISTGQQLDGFNALTPLLTGAQLTQIKEEIKLIKVSDRLLDYVMAILQLSRTDSNYQPLSPRAGRDLVNAAKAWAYIHGRQFVLPDDIQSVLPNVLSHRLSPFVQLSSEQELSLCKQLMEQVRVDQPE